MTIRQFHESKENKIHTCEQLKENRNKEFNEICKLVQVNKEGFNSETLERSETLEMKSSTNQIKNSVEAITSRLDQTEDRVAVLADKVDELEQLENNKNKMKYKQNP